MSDQPQDEMRHLDEMQRRSLIAALVHYPNKGRLYVSSARFHYAIDTLARMLPLWVEGLAAHAERQDAETQARIESLRQAGGLVVSSDLERQILADPEVAAKIKAGLDDSETVEVQRREPLDSLDQDEVESLRNESVERRERWQGRKTWLEKGE